MSRSHHPSNDTPTDLAPAELVQTDLAPSTPLMADSGLHCLECEYNLTGTIAAAAIGMGENRCPECGTTFDLQKLRDHYAGKPDPIAIWDDTRQNILWRYAQMCLITWFFPWRLPGLIPPYCHKWSLLKFRWISMVFVFVPTALLVIVTNFFKPSYFDIRDYYGTAMCGLLLWGIAAIVEAILGAILTIIMGPRSKKWIDLDASVGTQWMAVVSFGRSFMILSINVFGLSYLFSPKDFYSQMFCFIYQSYFFLWWAIAISAAIFASRSAWWRRFICIVGVSILGLLAAGGFGGCCQML